MGSDEIKRLISALGAFTMPVVEWGDIAASDDDGMPYITMDRMLQWLDPGTVHDEDEGRSHEADEEMAEAFDEVFNGQ